MGGAVVMGGAVGVAWAMGGAVGDWGCCGWWGGLWVCGGVAVGVVWAMGGAVGEGGWKQKGGGSGAKNGWAGPLLSQGCPPPTPFACAALVPTNYPLLGSCHACCCLNCMPNCMIVVQAQLGCAPVQVGLIGPNRLPHPRCAYCN